MIGCRLAERQLLAGQRDVDDLLAQPPVELVVGELALARVDRRLEPLADAVEPHAALAVAHPAQRLGDRALAAEEAHADVLDLVRRRGSGDRAGRLRLVRLPIQSRSNVSSFVAGRTVESPGSSNGGLGARPRPRLEPGPHKRVRSHARHDDGQHSGVSLYDKIAHLYDPWSASVVEDIEFYVEEARRSGGPVVELAVGTGRIAVPIAQSGIAVIGVDSSAGMLEVAREYAASKGSRSTCASATCATRRSRARSRS